MKPLAFVEENCSFEESHSYFFEHTVSNMQTYSQQDKMDDADEEWSLKLKLGTVDMDYHYIYIYKIHTAAFAISK